MPQAIPAAIASWQAFMAASTAAKLMIVGKFLLTTALMTAASYGLARLVAKKPSIGSMSLHNGGSPLDMTIEPDTARRVVYGETRVGGSIRLKHITGTNNQYLYLIYVLAGHPCEAIGDIYFGDEIVPLDGSGNATGTFAGFCRITKHLGATDQAADTNFVNELGSVWTSDHRLRGCCYLAIRLSWSQDKFPGGPPVITAVVKGKNDIYDSRDESTGWSDNPALCLRDYMLDSKIGLQGTSDDLIEASFVAASNGCDESVNLDAGGTEPRYRLNGSFDTSVIPSQIVEAMLDAMGGKIYDVGGQVYVRAAVWEAPDFDLDETMLRAGVNTTSPLSIRELYNAVKGTFSDPAELYARNDFPAVVSDAFIAADGRELMADIDLPFVTSPTQAQRIAKIALLRTRQGIVAELPCNLRAVPAQPGKNVRISNTKRSWTNKHFEVLEFTFATQQADDGGLGFVTDVIGQETDASIYDWSTDEEDINDPAPNTGTYNPRTVATPAKPTLSTSNFVQPDGSITPRIQVQWVLPTDVFVTNGGRVHIEYKKTADSTWLAWDSAMAGAVDEDFITGVHAGVSYDVRIAFENYARVRGAWSEHESITIGNDSTVPDAPTGLTATAGPGCVVLDWDDNAEADLDHYELWRSASSDFSSPSLVWTGYASQHADFTAVVGTTYYYKLKASDTSDNLSGYSSQVSAAANDTTGPAGAAGGYTDYIFKRAATAPATPTGDTPAGWSDAPPAADGNPLWMSVGDKTNAGVLVGAWSTPVNTDTGLIFEYSVDGSTSWHTTFTAGDLYARHKVLGGSFTAAYRIVGEQGATGATGPQGPEGPQGPAGPTGPEGPALTYSLTIDWHPSGLGGGTINGTPYTGTSTTVTGLNPGSWVDITADANVSGDNWTSWGGASVGQLEQSTGTNSNRILMGGNLSLIANY